jgi:hypothetical protein
MQKSNGFLELHDGTNQVSFYFLLLFLLFLNKSRYPCIWLVYRLIHVLRMVARWKITDAMTGWPSLWYWFCHISIWNMIEFYAWFCFVSLHQALVRFQYFVHLDDWLDIGISSFLSFDQLPKFLRRFDVVLLKLKFLSRHYLRFSWKRLIHWFWSLVLRIGIVDFLRCLIKAGRLKGALYHCVDICVKVLLGLMLRSGHSKVILKLSYILMT